MKNFLKIAAQILLLSVAIAQSGSAFAFTSIASIKGNVLEAWYRSSNYESQKEADKDALEGCRVTARKNGIGNLAKKCAVVTRAKGPGYGAIVCGDDGCNWATGYATAQEAVDAAYGGCAKTYANCQEKDISYWDDFAGFNRKVAAASPATSNCRPRTSSLTCKSSCTNGNCIVTYPNGCQMRVRLSPQFNSFNNRWEYPAPSC